MKKIFLIFLFLLLLLPPKINALEYPNLHYQKAIIYDLTDNKTLYELNSEEEVSIASLTKLLTIITAIEKNEDMYKKITYSQEMKNNVMWYASVAGFRVGDVLTFEDLLYAAMLPSGADATVALAITTSGSLESFVIEMNVLAKKIDMNNSNFVNVHGLDEDNHYSTAEDLRKLLEYSLENEIFKKIYMTKEHTLSTGKTIKSTIKKTSDAAGINIDKILGSKTGTTGNAGLCISTLLMHENHEIIIITLGAPQEDKKPYNITDALTLIEFIENNYHEQSLLQENKVIKKIKVKTSKQREYEIKTNKNISMFLEDDYNKDLFKIEYSGLNELSHKNKKGQKIGRVKYLYNDKELSEEVLYLHEELEIDYSKILKENKDVVLFGIIMFITTIVIVLSSIKVLTSN